MHRAMIAFVLICMAMTVCADPGLNIATSKRIPTVGNDVSLAAYLDDWQEPEEGSYVVFVAQMDGVEKAIGKTRIAANSKSPFQPGVKWTPDRTGLFRIIARVEGSELEARLLLPVVAQDVYFCFYGATRPETTWMTHHLTAGASEIDALHAQGVVALKHALGVHYVGGPRPENVHKNIDFKALSEKIVNDYTQLGPYDGIAIDEWGMWEQHPEHEQLVQALWPILQKARAEAPDKFFATWQFASLTPLMCNIFRDSMDLIMCEVYQNYFRAWYDQHTFYDFIQQRIDVARKMMVAKKTIIGLSITKTYGSITPQELEDQIRYIRTKAPEMRGLSFFTTSSCDDEVLKHANDCCYRYWVKPAVGLFSEADVTFSDYQPEHLGIVRVQATVHNVGGMDARNVKIRFWDGDPANGGVQIGGVQSVPVLPAARWIDPEARDSASWDPPEAIRADGFGMVTVSLNWKATRGSHEIWAEIAPDEQYTTIRAYESKRIAVR